jgi:nucleotide-binding universal stress UspA family protein
MGPLLCGVDFSEHSLRALTLAFAMAARLDLPLKVVTVIDPLLAETGEPEFGPGRILADAQRDLNVLVASVVDAASLSAASVASIGVVGSPAPALLRVASTEHGSIIVVGTQGVGWARRLWFGSTTVRLLRAAAVPVLAVPAPDDDTIDPATQPHLGFDRVLCGVDFGSASRAAARMAATLSSQLSLPLTLMHVVAPTPVKDAWTGVATSVLNRAVEEGMEQLDAIAAGLNTPVKKTEVKTGEPAEILVEDAATGARALVVIGLGSVESHARPGATSSLIISHSKAPVLVVPEEIKK